MRQLIGTSNKCFSYLIYSPSFSCLWICDWWYNPYEKMSWRVVGSQTIFGSILKTSTVIITYLDRGRSLIQLEFENHWKVCQIRGELWNSMFAHDRSLITSCYFFVCYRDIVELLLSHEASKNIVDLQGSSPLHLAAWSGNEEIVWLLLTHGPSTPNVNLMVRWHTKIRICELRPSSFCHTHTHTQSALMLIQSKQS